MKTLESSTHALTDSRRHTCFTSGYTYEPYIEITLRRPFTIHTVKLKSNSPIPTVNITVGGDFCSLADSESMEVSCPSFPTSDTVKVQVFAQETELTLCEVEIFGRKNSIWEKWSEWSSCSGSCHFGLKERTRECSG